MGRLRGIKKSKDTHFKDEYGTVEQPTRGFVCHFCKKIFQSKYSLDKHTKIHLREKVLTCEMCGKLLYDFVSRKNTHPEARSHWSLLNEVSEKLLKDESQLKHVSQTKENKAYVCEVCKHRFADEAAFAIHCRQHKIKKRTFCHKCSQM